VVDEADESRPKKKRGPKGHARKSQPIKKKRVSKRLARRRQAKKERAKQQWEAWDRLPKDVKMLLGKKSQPRLPRPKNED
jgi:hypothetical protein